MSGLNHALPILQRRREIEDAVRAHQVVVICGETGSGKTTQLPQIVLDMALPGVIGHTQPRRLAARAVAARIAEERGEAVGGLVGVKIRFDDQTGPRTRIKLMTDGVLLAELAGDAGLRSYGTIIIDEAHERSLNIDFLLGYLRRLLPRRPELKVVVTSATIDPRRFSEHFGGPSVAPVIEVSGRTYPVEIRYREVEPDAMSGERVDTEAVADAVEELAGARAGGGDTLVFLPGEREIRAAGDALRRRGLDAEVLPLFSRLTNQEQDRIFHPGSRRRVILATNVAETSLTVPGIRYVVDTGLARINRYDPARKIQRLPIEAISRAAADQRAGRCGRVEAGVCIRLYSEASYRERAAFTDPEIRRTSLASVILQMKAMDLGPIEEFAFLDPPDAAAVKDGYETLFELGAIASAERGSPLTEIGRRMSRIPADPRVARMLLGAEREGALNEVLVLAAALSIQDPRERPIGRQEHADQAQAVFRDESSDFLTQLKIWDQYQHAARTMGGGALAGWCRDHYLSAARMREWGETARQLRDVAEEIGLRPSRGPASEEAVHRALITGLISNVACREGEGGAFEYRGVRGNRVQIFPGSVLFKKSPKWIIAAEIVQTTKLYARTVARVDPAWIEELAGHMFRHQLSDLHLDAQTGEPSAWERVTMSGIVVVPRRRTAISAVDPAAARELFIRDGLVRGKWESTRAFMSHNREVMARARAAEAKVRRRDVLRPEDELVGWFASRLPASVVDPASLAGWLARADAPGEDSLKLRVEDVVTESAAAAFDASMFPDSLEVAGGDDAESGPLSYVLAPGKDEDGVTLTVTLRGLSKLSEQRAAWLVPGMLEELVQALLKVLPKAVRAELERKAPIGRVATECAQAVAHGQGSLPAALSEAVEVLFGVKIEPAAWSIAALPAYLRMRVRVVDESGKELGADRDVPALQGRFSGRIQKDREARARRVFGQTGLTKWTFGELPDPAEAREAERAASSAEGVALRAYAALEDHGASVALTLMDSSRKAAAHTAMGLRRLFALACEEEARYYVEALPRWDEMVRHYAQLGSADELRRDVISVIAERVFMEGQSWPLNKPQFEERLESCWGRLAPASREVGEMIAETLEPRFRVAQRISGGTPRLWADSVADIREHAAYLMPRRFLLLAPAEKLRQYPRYAGLMRDRLFSLREDGSRAETDALRRFAPHWKRFTGWVAAAMSAERAAALRDEEPAAAPSATSPKTKAPLPAARRSAPTVNIDAGEWALQPGRLPAEVERYRWALEELRVALFSPSQALKNAPSAADVEGLRRAVETMGSSRTA